MKINIFDNNFIPRGKSSTRGKSPRTFSYVVGKKDFQGITIYTNGSYLKARTTKSKYKIAWQLESPAYAVRLTNPKDFDQIWTYSEAAIKSNPQLYKRANSGGTWVKTPTMFEKSKGICVVDGGRRKTRNQRMRAEAKKLPMIDSFGRGTDQPFENIEDVYRDYRFVVVIENICDPNYFSEKLTDAIACGCIPIYCGSEHNAERFFPGLTRFKNIGQLAELIPKLTPEFYEKNKPVEHFKTVNREFYTTDDWLVAKYISCIDI